MLKHAIGPRCGYIYIAAFAMTFTGNFLGQNHIGPTVTCTSRQRTSIQYTRCLSLWCNRDCQRQRISSSTQALSEFTSGKQFPSEGTATKIMKRNGNEDINVRISKDMSRILRHKPPPGAMDAAGWVSLPVLLRHMRHQPTEQQIRQIVENCEKKRFVIDDNVAPPRIRAAQGHTVQLAEAVLEPVTDPNAVLVAVHVTSVSSWEAIQASGQLLRMKRTHIHFATQPHHLRKNTWAEVYLRLDLEAALQSGLHFYMSSNGVLLCEGPVAVGLVREVEWGELPEGWRSGAGTGPRRG